MELASEVVGVLLAVTLAVATAAVALSLLALSGQRRVRMAYDVFADADADDVLEALRSSAEEVRALRRDVVRCQAEADALRAELQASLRRVGIVRYDAFEDMGGRVSFSTALLDDHGHGVVLTAINGRSETRTYAKPIRGAASDHGLSDEEQEAIRRALDGDGGAPGGATAGRDGARAAGR